MWEWQTVATVGTFAFTVAVFAFFIVRAILMKRHESERMSLLPVESDRSPNDTSQHERIR
jgi:hypothetical protein